MQLEPLTSGPARRRCEKRRLLNLRGYARFENGTTFNISLLDLSGDGCKIESSLALLPDLPLELCIAGIGEFAGKVRWCSSGRAGLSLGRAERARHIDNRRRDERLKIRLNAIVRQRCGGSYPSRIFDFGRGGCRLEFLKRPTLGEKVMLRFVGLDALEGDVRWCADFDAGVEFQSAIHPAVFQVLAAHHLKALWLSDE